MNNEGTTVVQNTVICCDGTGNQFAQEGSNVLRLIRAIDRAPGVQRIYYDPGVGTLPKPSAWGNALQKCATLFDQATGSGFMRNVLEAYAFLMNYWEPGSPVFLFGFSRGAYEVRALAGLLHMLGLLPRGNENLIPYLKDNFKSVYDKKPEDAKRQFDICDDFRRTFARDVGIDRHFPIHFLGVWDTVSSVGWFRTPGSYSHTRHNPSIANIWHAISIDERRAFFRQNLMEKDTSAINQEFHERWFPGDHSDIGGGHGKGEGGLWRCAFDWILRGAYEAGLIVSRRNYDEVVQG